MEVTKFEVPNRQRGKYFQIVNEVWVDGGPLAEMLKAKGLVKDCEGEGEGNNEISIFS